MVVHAIKIHGKRMKWNTFDQIVGFERFSFQGFYYNTKKYLVPPFVKFLVGVGGGWEQF